MLPRLRAWLQNLQHGVHGAGLRSQLKPNQMIRLAETLRDGDGAAVSRLYLDVGGEAISLAAGASLYGGQAMQALSDAHGDAVVALRGRVQPFANCPSIYIGAQRLLEANRQALMDWIKTGKLSIDTADTPSDMSRIAGAFLTTQRLRTSAASAFLSTNEVMHAGLGLFSSPHG